MRITGDHSVLNESVSYIEGRALNAGEESYYDLPTRSSLVESLYQHCRRALDYSLPRGAHASSPHRLQKPRHRHLFN